MRAIATSAFSGERTARPSILTASLCFLLLATGCSQAPKPVLEIQFFPALPETPRLQFLTTISDEEDVGAKSSAFREFVVGDTEGPMSLGRPWDVAHEKGKLYVVDRGLGQVVIIDLVDHRFDLFPPSAAEALRGPFGIFVSDAGYKYVADRERSQILVFDEKNVLHRVYRGEGRFAPLDVAVNGDRLYVCDVKDKEIEVLDKASGETVATIGGGRSEEEGPLSWPTHLSIGADGWIYVTDLLDFHVQVYDAEGRFVRSIGEPGDFPGAMPRPKGIAVDREKNLYVVDSAFEMVQIFEAETGKVLMPLGKFGPNPGSHWLPTGIDIDYENLEFFSRYLDEDFRPEYLVYVTNQAGPNKINVYAFGQYIGSGAR